MTSKICLPVAAGFTAKQVATSVPFVIRTMPHSPDCHSVPFASLARYVQNQGLGGPRESHFYYSWQNPALAPVGLVWMAPFHGVRASKSINTSQCHLSPSSTLLAGAAACFREVGSTARRHLPSRLLRGSGGNPYKSSSQKYLGKCE